ncbi:MAG: hypothetical protein ABEJ58_08875 [Halodesulfurarchaeum sp.]
MEQYGHVIGSVPSRFRSYTSPRAAYVIASLFAFVPAAFLLLLRIAINTPIGSRVPSGVLYEPTATVALVGPAVGALVLAVTTENGAIRIGSTFAGVFGLLVALDTSASVPAAVAITGAAVVVLAATAHGLARPLEPDRLALILVSVGFVGAIVLSMAAYLGIAQTVTRPLGSKLAVLSIAASPVFSGYNRRTIAVGLLAGAAVAGFVFSAPFVAGATMLVAFGLVDTSILLVLLGTVGGVTLVSTGLGRGRLVLALAGATLLVAGVPASIHRALPFFVGFVLLVSQAELASTTQSTDPPLS